MSLVTGTVDPKMVKGSQRNPKSRFAPYCDHAISRNSLAFLWCGISIQVMAIASTVYVFWIKILKYDTRLLGGAKDAQPPETQRSATVCTVSKPKLKSSQWYRELYFKLQNLEDHGDVLELARDELLAMFSRAISDGLEDPERSILDLGRFDAGDFTKFIESEQDKVMDQWSHYLKHREQGGSPELFTSVKEAKEWVVKQAPVKFIDGAWLSHVHKITTPFALRASTKNAWQVLSEELGDGDISKHHVHLYRELLKEIGCELPEGHSADFVDPSLWDERDNDEVWRAAVGQLLISLFPNEFLPEILGFNLRYELITLGTLQANHELKEIGINPYYFLIHIVIDNADSGHAAMAAHTVTNYLGLVRATEGESAMEQAWKRVQAGYVLSMATDTDRSGQENDENSGIIKKRDIVRNISFDPLSARILDIFKAKALTSHQLHCQSRARIGGQKIAEWLSPSVWEEAQPEKRMQFLAELKQARPWIYPGASNKSLLMREVAWEGKMFGAFTHDEATALGAWIDALGPDGGALTYWNFTTRDPIASREAVSELTNPTCHHPVIVPRDCQMASIEYWMSLGLNDPQPPPTSQPLGLPTTSHLNDVIVLWFAHIGLLENTINTPSRSVGPIYANMIRILRAQAGFALETPIVAGMDEMKRLTCPSLVDLGLELVSSAEWSPNAAVESLHDVFAAAADHGTSDHSVEFARSMLDWATCPGANLGLLLGLAWAFLELKDVVARAPRLLARESQVALHGIVERERQGVEECVRQIRKTGNNLQRQGVSRGYWLGIRKLQEICN